MLRNMFAEKQIVENAMYECKDDYYTNTNIELHYVTLATKLLHVVLFHEDITQQDLKKSSPWYPCDKRLHRVSAMLVHYF